MVALFSWLRGFFRKYLSCVSFKTTCGKVSDVVKNWGKKDDTKAYSCFVWRVLKRLWLAFSQAFVSFGAAVTILYLGWGLSLLIKGWSGTMTPGFEATWLLLAAKIGVFVFIVLFIIGIYVSVSDFRAVRRKLKSPIVDKQPEKFVTVADFEEFKREVRDGFSNINKRLDELIRNRSD